MWVVSSNRAFVGDDSARMLAVKIATIGHGRTSINTSSGFTAQSTAGPLGAVTYLEDAQRLIAALASIFPGDEFIVERQDHPEAHFVFHTP